MAPPPPPDHPAPFEGDAILRDFRFASGEALPEVRMHCTTIGSPQRDPAGVVRNAVLVLHGTGGTGRQFLGENFAGVLFSRGQLLDGHRYYLILPDSVGHGRSSKPSDGLRARFPRYTYQDMVLAQYRLLTEHLQINHLRLVMGTSMGGMHSWLWGCTYPAFMDALMPLASAPVAIAGLNRIRRRMIIDSIRNDPEWKNGDYTTQPPGLTAAFYSLMLMTASPLQLYQQAPTREAADALFDRRVREGLARADANNMLYAYESSRDYDPSRQLESIRAPLAAINSEDDAVNPPELGILEREIRRVPRGRFVLLPATTQTRGHGSHSLPRLWKTYLEELLDRSATEPRLPAARSPARGG